MRRIFVLLVVTAAALVLASAATANSLTCAHGATCSSGALSPPGSGTLPFTGLDLAGAAAIAALLFASGTVLRRVGRRRQ